MKISSKKLSRRSIRTYIYIAFTSLFAAAILFLFINTRKASSNAFTLSAQNSSRREIATISSSVESTLNHLIDYSVTVSLNDTLIQSMGRYPSPPSSEAELYNLKQELNSIINSIIGMNKAITYWDILSLTGDFFNIGGYDLSSMNVLDSSAIINLHSDYRGALISGPYQSQQTFVSSDEEQYYFIISKPIVNLDTRKIRGYVIFLIEDSSISSLFEDYLPEDSGSSFFIVDYTNTVLLSSDAHRVQTSFFGNELNELTDSQYLRLCTDGMLITKDSSRIRYIYAATTLNKFSWTLINKIPLHALMKEEAAFNRYVLICLFITLILLAILGFIIAKKITEPILILAEEISHATENAYETISIPSAPIEIQVFYTRYNELMLRTQELLDSIYAEQEAKTDFQYRLIQAQIKPHFLYNTLEMIKSMVDLGMLEEASEAITSLSIFYRLSLSKGMDIINIKNEMDIAREYLHLEKLRHMEYFEYSIEVQKEADAYMIPKLSLQPIIENAIVHGVSEKGTKGFIQLTVRENESNILFIVEDDGPGIEKNRLEELNRLLQESASIETESFGLSNINRRIRMIYGSIYGLHIESEPGKYTRTILTIPKMNLNGTASPIN